MDYCHPDAGLLILAASWLGAAAQRGHLPPTEFPAQLLLTPGTAGEQVLADSEGNPSGVCDVAGAQGEIGEWGSRWGEASSCTHGGLVWGT